MMDYKVDYHIHSYYSDGTMSPTEIVKKYNSEEYDIISITDHDGIDGVREGMIAGDALNLKVVPGIELSTDYEGLDFHILGYHIDIENEDLLTTLNKLKEYRRNRNRKLVEILRNKGYDIDIEKIENSNRSKYVGKPNIARELVAKGYISEYNEAFDSEEFFRSKEITGLKKKKLSSVEAIELIRTAGGIPVLAHPGKIKGIGDKTGEEYWQKLDQIIYSLKKAGLKGLECYYPAHSPEDTFKYVQLSEKYHLHITTGSDFHGDK